MLIAFTHTFLMFRLRSGISTPSSSSSQCITVEYPLIYSLSIHSSKCFSSSSPICLDPELPLDPLLSLLTYSYCFAFYYCFPSFNPRADALDDFSLGVVATRWALLKSIISLKDSKSDKLRRRSIIYSSISSFLCYTVSINLSMLKFSISSLNLYRKLAILFLKVLHLCTIQWFHCTF